MYGYCATLMMKPNTTTSNTENQKSLDRTFIESLRKNEMKR